MGCGIAVGVIVLLIIIGGIIVACNARKWGANLAEKGLHQAIDQSSLTDAQKSGAKLRITDLATGFKNKDITLEDMGKIVEEMETSPLIPAVVVQVIKDAYIAPSGLTDEEKAEGGLALDRLARGVFEGSISPERAQEIAAPMDKNTSNDQLDLKEPGDVTDDELRQIIADAKAEADAQDIPEEAWDIDFVAELDKLIENALGRPLPSAE